VVTLEGLRMLIEREPGAASCPVLVQALSSLLEFRKEALLGKQPPAGLARSISKALHIVGFPGERNLDSVEYQALKKWQEVLSDFAGLKRVVSHIGYSEAVSRLRSLSAELLFQPETPEVPIQVLGVLEAAGMEFDHLWVTGMSDATWPPPASPNPLLPVGLQRAAEIPQCSAAGSFELANRLTNAWLSSAGEIVLSHPRHVDRHDDRELGPSPLVSGIAEGGLSLPDYTQHADLIHAAGSIESIQDDHAPALAPYPVAPIRGGAGLLKDYAACPFRACALVRLQAQGIRTPHSGLDAMERGILVHHVVAEAWARIKTKSMLDAISDEELDALLSRAADKAIEALRRERPAALSGRFRQIEHRRLTRLGQEWLKEERKRGDFTVVAIEDQRLLEIGGLTLSTRLDRLDELADGRRIIVDYKTSAPPVAAMLGDRPEEPQLPLYLVAADPDAAAIAFAQVRTGGMHFAALARDNDLLPGVKAYSDSQVCKQHGGTWEQLVEVWGKDLKRIADGFSDGIAAVDPKKYPVTCRNCDLQTFCRIDERTTRSVMQKEEVK
jgi:ATP-dependent helicase/nuclease subunit B